MQGVIAQQIDDFVKYPPRQKPASFNLDSVMEQAQAMGKAAQKPKPDAAQGSAPAAQKEPALAK
jgi:hypothetical protein